MSAESRGRKDGVWHVPRARPNAAPRGGCWALQKSEEQKRIKGSQEFAPRSASRDGR